jgi:glucokinase
MILAGDIGGTKTHVALFDWTTERVDPIYLETYPSRDYDSLEQILTEFSDAYRQSPKPACGTADEAQLPKPDEESAEDEQGPTVDVRLSEVSHLSIEAACFGVAGPVINNRCHTTNLPWVVDGAELAKRFDIPIVRLLNDLEATAYGLLLLRPDETEVLNPMARPVLKRAIGLIAAGTGLGESVVFWDGACYCPMPSEGGHCDFAPNTDLEIALLRHLRTAYLHVSYERVLSGPGLHAIYEFLRDTNKNEPTWLAERLKAGDPAAVITEVGLAGQAEICVQALDLFVSIYGAEAGNLALKALSLGGVYVGGGIAPRILSKLKEGTFMRTFTAKGRYKRLLSTIPVHVITNPQTALLGAASMAARLQKAGA